MSEQNDRVCQGLRNAIKSIEGELLERELLDDDLPIIEGVEIVEDPVVDSWSFWEKRREEEALAADTQEVQDMLYPEQTVPMRTATTVLPNGKTGVLVTGISNNPVIVMSAAHPEFAAAMKKYGVDPHARPGHELEEMKKYFGQGSGTYLVTVDFQIARTEAFKLDEKALKKMTKALKPVKAPKKTAKKKPVRKLFVSSKPYRKRGRR